MDLNKEIKLSALFRRRPKEADADPAAPDAARDHVPPPDENGARASILKRDISFGRRKKSADDRPARKAKAPKRPRGRREKKAAPVAQIPLMRAFDLLPREDAREVRRRRPSTAQLVLAVVGLVLVAALGSLFLLENARVADKERTRDDLKAQLAAKNVPAAEPETQAVGSDPALADERNRRTTAVASALATRVAWDRILRELALVLPDDVWLTSMSSSAGATAEGSDPSAAPPTTSLQLNGYTRAQEGVARLLARMSVLPELEAVQLVSSTTVELGKEKVVEFTISATVKSSPSGATT
jgi:Tfp pilus assembly protein PilN